MTARDEGRTRTRTEMLASLREIGYRPRYVASDEPDLTDDEIVLSNVLSIQICESGGYAITRRRGDTYTYWDKATWPEVVDHLKDAFSEFDEDPSIASEDPKRRAAK